MQANQLMMEAAFRAITAALKEQGFTIKAKAMSSGQERQVLIVSVSKDNQTSAIMFKLDHLNRSSKNQMEDFEPQTFWHGYTCGVSETAIAVMKAITKNDYSDIDGMHEENPEARIDIEILCKALGADIVSKLMRRDRR